jgi:hypothetical protein
MAIYRNSENVFSFIFRNLGKILISVKQIKGGRREWETSVIRDATSSEGR